MILLSGNSNKLLANHISTQAGIALSEMDIKRFADGEISCEIHDNIRGEDVFIIQSTLLSTNIKQFCNLISIKIRYFIKALYI